MDVLSFRWRGRFGHFLRAEANVNALSYPVPPRTAVLGLLAAILGLGKDALCEELDAIRIAIMGAPPKRFWHRVKLRKDPPAALPKKIRATQKGASSPKPEKAALVRQEWLFNPDFLIHCAFPDHHGHLSDLVERIQDQRWHFSPCMGLSELLANVDFVDLAPGEPLPLGEYLVETLCPAEQVELQTGDGLGIHLLRMPYGVDSQRVFRHVPVYMEHQGKPIPVKTDAAWRVRERLLCFI